MVKVETNEQNEYFVKIAERAFEILELSGDAVLDVEMADEQTILDYNKRFRNIEKVTDVLSFPSIEKIMPFTQKNYPYEYDEQMKAVDIGSIMICNGVAAKQAAEYGHSLKREIAYLFLHGVLHLLGFDHMTEQEKLIMRKYEEEILEKLDITR